MKLTCEKGFGAGAFLFLFIMAGLCLAASLIRMAQTAVLSGIALLIVLIVLGFRKKKRN